MPLYDIKCRACETQDTIWRKVAQRDEIPVCKSCGSEQQERVISAVMVITDITPFVSPATGRVINSRVALRNDLEASGNIMNEPGLKKDIARNKVYQEEKTYAPVAAAVDETVRQLVNAGKIES